MNYNPEEQFRCTIIRGKAKNMLDNLLPAYANIIDDICPCDKASFVKDFNNRLIEILGEETTKKTLDNHRTEIAGKLFGMFYEDDEVIFPSGRTNKYIEDSDQPAFFKDICFKFQFPNGMDKLDKVIEKVGAKIQIRQFPYILQVLLTADNNNIQLSKDDIAYYVLNSLQVLQGKIKPIEVIEKIIEDRSNDITKKVRHPGKETSYSMQHIREQLNYLELANLIRIDGNLVKLNYREAENINYIAQFWGNKPEFNAYKYDFTSEDDKKSFFKDWQQYYSNVNSHKSFTTTVEALDVYPTKPTYTIDKNALGDEGENLVLEYEKERVKLFDPSLVRKVVHLGKTKGLGYDIQSVVAEDGDFAEFVKYIEVKSTKRVTVPNLDDPSWIDTINLTRNEWIAATQHKSSYYLYRVYFTPGLATMYVINDPFTKNKDDILRAKPVSYRLDFSNKAVDFMVTEEKEEYR
ncbi:protein NO VEIN domain-containing protein [Bacillus safensis]|uniref:Restriction endonuclease R.BpuJI n=2 Tax=Bacillus pumilus TaxID=1408 RepID=A3FMN7_BACPU|nr:restriction endonuclease R.BpuJI [Bacillus pumilus]